jgi:hypothetical protein
LLRDFEKLLNDLLRRNCAIREEKVIVIYPLTMKPRLIVRPPIQPYHTGNPHFVEDRSIVFWGAVVEPTELIIPLGRICQREELPWDYPVAITVFDFLSVFILFDVKGGYIKPAKVHSFSQGGQAVKDGAVIVAIDLACITEWDKGPTLFYSPPALLGSSV